MALKDWKKVKQTLNYIQYDKKGTTKSLIIKRNPEDSRVFAILNKYNSENIQWVVLYPINYSHDFKNFKTKSKALAFAKSYMRKN